MITSPSRTSGDAALPAPRSTCQRISGSFTSAGPGHDAGSRVVDLVGEDVCRAGPPSRSGPTARQSKRAPPHRPSRSRQGQCRGRSPKAAHHRIPSVRSRPPNARRDASDIALDVGASRKVSSRAVSRVATSDPLPRTTITRRSCTHRIFGQRAQALTGELVIEQLCSDRGGGLSTPDGLDALRIVRSLEGDDAGRWFDLRILAGRLAAKPFEARGADDAADRRTIELSWSRDRRRSHR